jgi:hypothetical protein
MEMRSLLRVIVVAERSYIEECHRNFSGRTLKESL